MRRLRPLHYPSITSDVLQINSEAATSPRWESDLIDESKNSPMAIPAYTAPSPPYSSQRLSVYKRTHINTITSRGWCALVYTDKKEQTHNLSSDFGCYELATARRWKVEVRRVIFTARGWRWSLLASSNSTWFHGAQTMTNRPARVHVLGGVSCKYLLVVHSVVLEFLCLLLFLFSKDLLKGFGSLDQHHQEFIHPDQWLKLVCQSFFLCVLEDTVYNRWTWQFFWKNKSNPDILWVNWY